jgi:hypothetical protein
MPEILTLERHIRGRIATELLHRARRRKHTSVSLRLAMDALSGFSAFQTELFGKDYKC